jgi:hypothetical protein
MSPILPLDLFLEKGLACRGDRAYSLFHGATEPPESETTMTTCTALALRSSSFQATILTLAVQLAIFDFEGVKRGWSTRHGSTVGFLLSLYP